MVSTHSKDRKISRAKTDPHPTDKLAGIRLRTRRRLVGLSQSQLGKAIGVSFQQIQKYENGINRLSASSLEQIARILDVDVGYFFIETLPTHRCENEQTSAEDALDNDGEFLHSRETLELIRAYRKIKDPKKRRKIYELIKSMADKVG